MKRKQSFLNGIFILVILLNILANNFLVHSIKRIVLTVVSAVLVIPYMFLLLKNKLYENRLNIFATILLIYQIINVVYYSHIFRA